MSRQRASVTINDVARHVGVAKGTVSRAINNYDDISDATRLRILDAIKELGYEPSATARNLKRGRQDTLGIVISADGALAADSFPSDFILGFSHALYTLDRDLLLIFAHSSEQIVETLERLIARRKVDGFVLTRTEPNDQQIALLSNTGVPFVTFGRTADSSGYAWIDIDKKIAFSDAVKHVVDLGHRSIGFVGGPDNLNFAHECRDGYRSGLDDAGLIPDLAFETRVDVSERGGSEGARRLLSLPVPPTALLCVDDSVAIGAIRRCRDLGLAVGKDVSIIGYGSLPAGPHINSSLTTYSHSAHDAGERVASMLMDIIDGTLPTERQELARAKLIRRASDGPPTKSPEELGEFLRRRRSVRL